VLRRDRPQQCARRGNSDPRPPRHVCMTMARGRDGAFQAHVPHSQRHKVAPAWLAVKGLHLLRTEISTAFLVFSTGSRGGVTCPKIHDLLCRFRLQRCNLTLCRGGGLPASRAHDPVGRAKPNAHKWVLGCEQITHSVLHRPAGRNADYLREAASQLPHLCPPSHRQSPTSSARDAYRSSSTVRTT
jgi:hypothetical protein